MTMATTINSNAENKKNKLDRMLTSARSAFIGNLTREIWDDLNDDWHGDIELAAAALGQQIVQVEEIVPYFDGSLDDTNTNNDTKLKNTKDDHDDPKPPHIDTVLTRALEYGLDLCDLPAKSSLFLFDDKNNKNNIELLVKIVQSRPELFQQLRELVPPELVWKVTCCLTDYSIGTGNQPTLARQVLDIYPSLRQSKTLWRTIITQFPYTASYDSITSLLRDYATTFIKSDPGLMKLAFQQERGVYQVFDDDSLLHNHDFVHELVRIDLYFFCRLPEEWQLTYQNLLLQQLLEEHQRQQHQQQEQEVEKHKNKNNFHHDSQRCCSSLSSSLFEGNLWRIQWFSNDLHPQLWTRRDIVLAWIQCGGNFASHFPLTFRNDMEIFLNVAKYTQRICKLTSFQLADITTLRSNREFMKMAIQHDYVLWELVETDQLRQDFELAVLAFSGAASQVFFDDYYRTFPDQEHFLQSTYRNVKSKLENHNVFCQHVLVGISDSHSFLSSLRHGEETTRAWLMLLANYLNAPVSSHELRILQRAFKNMRTFPTTTTTTTTTPSQ